MSTDVDQVWRWIDAERRAMAATLAALPRESWDRPSLCDGWTIKDVGWRDLVVMTGRNLGRGYNSMVRREVQRLGRTQTVEQVLADFETFDGSRHKVPTVTVREPLIDALVHHQDIVRPLGLHHQPDLDAAAVAADRALTLAFLLGARSAKRVTLVATDHDWTRGEGPVVTGPLLELLLVCTGRSRAAVGLSGAGASVIARQGLSASRS